MRPGEFRAKNRKYFLSSCDEAIGDTLKKIKKYYNFRSAR
jgi:hypothetical protein